MVRRREHSALRRYFIPLIYILLVAILPISWVESAVADTNVLLQAAKQQRLGQSAQWYALLHYHRDSLGRIRSDADDSQFFLDPEGKYNPERELAAALLEFGKPQESDAAPQCRFVARFRWLRQQLNIDAQIYPLPSCPEFESWRDLLAPNSATLIYPAAYLNNPASAFGHSFLRIDSADQSDTTRLLAYGASYAAATGGSLGFLYAFRAIFGFYVGNFSLTPYYLQVQKYSDLENRDIWEYSLSLTPSEVERMVEHLWELRGIKFDYYFFDENCASQLLALLDVARPELQLSGRFRLTVIPIDTIRDVLSREGLVSRALYRPSSNTVLGKRMKELSSVEIALAAQLGRGDRSVDSAEIIRLGVEKQALVLELASEYLRYRTLGKRREPTEEEKQRGHKLLLARSQMPVVSDPLVIPPPAIRPDQGHKSSRVSAAYGVEDEQQFVELRLRPAFHEHIDWEAGYPRGAQLQFLDTTARKYEGDLLKLEQLSVVEIISLSPRNQLINPVSWSAGASAVRYKFSDGERNLIYRGHAGPGLSYELGSGILLYGLVDLALSYSPDFDRNYAVGVSPEIGVFGDLGDRTRVRMRGKIERDFFGTEFTRWESGVELRYALTSEIALRGSFKQIREFDNYYSTGQVAFDLFF